VLARVEYCCQVVHYAGVDRFYELFGQRIRNARLGLGLNQEALAHRVGLERSSISNIEKGRQRVQLHMLLDFAAALEIEPTQLLPDPAAVSDPLHRVPLETRSFVRDVLKTARAQARG
jgi:transcriptional regulator with XRE-family HTH domain